MEVQDMKALDVKTTRIEKNFRENSRKLFHNSLPPLQRVRFLGEKGKFLYSSELATAISWENLCAPLNWRSFKAPSITAISFLTPCRILSVHSSLNPAKQKMDLDISSPPPFCPSTFKRPLEDAETPDPKRLLTDRLAAMRIGAHSDPPPFHPPAPGSPFGAPRAAHDFFSGASRAPPPPQPHPGGGPFVFGAALSDSLPAPPPGDDGMDVADAAAEACRALVLYRQPRLQRPLPPAVATVAGETWLPRSSAKRSLALVPYRPTRRRLMIEAGEGRAWVEGEMRDDD